MIHRFGPYAGDPDPEQLPRSDPPAEDPLKDFKDDELDAPVGPKAEDVEIEVVSDGPGSSLDRSGWKLDTDALVGINLNAPGEPLEEGHPVLVNETYIPGMTGRRIDLSLPLGPDHDLVTFTGRGR